MVERPASSSKSFDDARNRTPAEIIEHLHGADGAITSTGASPPRCFSASPAEGGQQTGTGVDNMT